MKRPRVTPIELSEEQEQFFIETWDNNPSPTALILLREQFGFGYDITYSIARRLREEGKLRDKQRIKYSDRVVLTFKNDYENGKSIKEIAESHNVDVKGVRKYLKSCYGGKLPKIKATLEGEIWKDIEGCNSHQVSNMGRIYVKSINTIIYGHLAHGYRHVSIQDDAGNKHKYAVHRLVAQAFVPNPDNKPQVDHIDSDPLNNRASNLRWVTQEEQLSNEDSKKKKQLGIEKKQKRWKIEPLIKKMLEIEPDKLELVKMIINYFNVKVNKIRTHIYRHFRLNGRYLRYNKEEYELKRGKDYIYSNEIKKSKGVPKPVYQFTIDGVFVRSYKNAHETAEYGFNYRHVSQVCNGKEKTHKGYVFRFEK